MKSAPFRPSIKLSFSLLCCLCFALPALRAETTIPLWAQGAPGPKHTQPEVSEDKRETGRADRWFSYVSEPSIAFYAAPADKATGTTVLVIPGGGFRYVCVDKEGIEPARWLNSIGIHAAVLKYRTIAPDIQRHKGTIYTYFGDTLRAMRVLRAHATALKVDEKRIGVMGFSAGAMMGLHLIGHEDQGKADAEDPIERVNDRANFAILVYGAPVSIEQPTLSKNSAPCYLVHTEDDPKAKVAGVKKLAKQLEKAGVPTTLKIYKTGGHGFGVQPSSGEVQAWPEECTAWLRSIGML